MGCGDVGVWRVGKGGGGGGGNCRWANCGHGSY